MEIALNLASVTSKNNSSLIGSLKSYCRHFLFLKASSIAILILLSFSSAISLGSSASAAEEAATPTKLYGTISGKDGAPLPNIGVAVIGPEGFAKDVATDAEGKWEVEILTKGTFNLTINQDDLPDGQALTDPTKSTVRANVFMLGVDLRLLFPIGPGVAKASTLERSAQLAVDGLILGLII